MTTTQKRTRRPPKVFSCLSPPSTDSISLTLAEYIGTGDVSDLFEVYKAERRDLQRGTGVRRRVIRRLRRARQALDARRQAQCRILRHARDLAIDRGVAAFVLLAVILDNIAVAIEQRRLPWYSKSWDAAVWDRHFAIIRDIRRVLDNLGGSEVALVAVLDQYPSEFAVKVTQEALGHDDGDVAEAVVEDEAQREAGGKSAGADDEQVDDPVAKAIGLQISNRRMTVEQLAKLVRVCKSTLYADERFSDMRKALKVSNAARRTNVPKGQKKDGHLEAEAPSSDWSAPLADDDVTAL